jgi:hypothetical protein
MKHIESKNKRTNPKGKRIGRRKSSKFIIIRLTA